MGDELRLRERRNIRHGIFHGGEEVPAEVLTPENSLLMRKGEAVTIRVRGRALRPGRHTLEIGVAVKDLGELRFTVGDGVR